MSLGAELLLERISRRFGPVRGLLSWTGQGCPLLDLAEQPPHRLSLRPLGGVTQGGGKGTAMWAPPFEVSRNAAAAARLMKSGLIVVDATGAASRNALWRALSPEVGVVRLRGAPEGPVGAPYSTLDRDGFDVIYEDRSTVPKTRDHILMRRSLVDDSIRSLAQGLMEGTYDEFDLLRNVIADDEGFRGLTFLSSYSECHFHPVRTLDQPDDAQLDAALGEGRFILDENGVASVVIPQMSANPAPVGVVIEDDQPDGPLPEVRFDSPGNWTMTKTRGSGGCQITATPVAVAPEEATAFEIRAPSSPFAEVTAVWAGVSRRRGAWEEWDEADARLSLEESW